MSLKFISRYSNISLRDKSKHVSEVFINTLIRQANFFKSTIREDSVSKYNDIMFVDGVMLDNTNMGGYAPLSKYKTNNMKRLTKKSYKSMI